jgi:hypothetical protein
MNLWSQLLRKLRQKDHVSPGVPGQLGQYSETLSQNKNPKRPICYQPHFRGWKCNSVVECLHWISSPVRKKKKKKERKKIKKFNSIGQAQWIKPIILAIWEAEIRRILLQDQSGQKV